jgi:hypothetical protein
MSSRTIGSAAGRLGALITAAAVLFAASASAGHSDACREWRAEHSELKGRAAGLVLSGAPQAKIDGVVFELLQREAYMSACRTSVARGRGEMVGWRLIGRPAASFGTAVLESILEQSGFDLSLASLGGRPRSPALTANVRASHARTGP